MTNLEREERIPVINTLRMIHVEYTLTAAKKKFKTEVYDGSLMMTRVYGKTRKKARKKALRFIYDTYNAPSNLDTCNLEYHQREDV